MSEVFLSIVETINRRKFRVIAPEAYMMKPHAYFVENGFDPIYSGGEGNLGETMIPITVIVDMMFHEIEFQIPSDDDHITIRDLLKQYCDAGSLVFSQAPTGGPPPQAWLEGKLFYDRAVMTYNKINTNLTWWFQNYKAGLPPAERTYTMEELMRMALS